MTQKALQAQLFATSLDNELLSEKVAMRAAGVGGVRKTAKALLKMQPSCLPLWLSYANAEEALGRPAEVHN